MIIRANNGWAVREKTRERGKVNEKGRKVSFILMFDIPTTFGKWVSNSNLNIQ